MEYATRILGEMYEHHCKKIINSSAYNNLPQKNQESVDAFLKSKTGIEHFMGNVILEMKENEETKRLLEKSSVDTQFDRLNISIQNIFDSFPNRMGKAFRN